MTLQEEIYAQGFIDKCADAVGASPEALVKECAEAGLIKEGFTAIELAIALAGILGLGYGGKKLYDYATKPKEPPVSPVRRILGQLGQKATGAVEGIKGLFTGAKEGEAMESLARGFAEKCAELGVDPEELAKWAQGRAYNPSVAAATKAKARQVGPGRLAATGVGGALIADKLKPSPKAGPAGGTMMAPAGAGKGRAFDPELASKTKTKALGAGAGSTLTSLGGGGGLIGSLAQRLRSGLTSAP